MTALLLLASVLLQGCAVGPYHLQYLRDSDAPLSYYVDKATSIEYPIESEPQETDPELFNAPRTLRTLEEATPREISLHECLKLALSESTILLDDQSLGSPGNPLLSRPSQAASIYDQAIQNTGFLFGNRGVEAALSDFDALATSSLTWGRDEVPQNLANAGIGIGQSLVQETMSWQSRLEKPLANGGQVSLSAEANYDGNNRPSRPTLGAVQAHSSAYTGQVQAEYRQPLLAGSGVEFNRIAGPASQSLRGVSGVSQGVLISRINNDISQTQFEQSVTILVRDVEQRYWDLDLALRLYASEKDAFEQLTNYLNLLRNRARGGAISGVPLLQTEARIFEADARLRGSLADVLEAEARLRRLCHLPLSDGTFLYPSDAPIEAEIHPDWRASLQEALSHRLELRRQKWEIKSLELQLKAARNLTRPRLDMVSQYRRNGLGDHFLGGGDTLGNDIANGQNEGWNIGFQLAIPVGLRLARIQERNYELRLKKAKAVLLEQEREIAHELSNAMLQMQRWFELADSTTRRIETSRDYTVLTRELVIGNERATADLFNLLLQAQIEQRNAEQAYMRSIVEYNKAFTDLRYRKGTLLTDNEIYLAEGNWHPAAANDALLRAKARTHGKDAHKLRTVPMEFVGQPAPTAWESINSHARPTTPGALEDAAKAGDPTAIEHLPPAVPGTPNGEPKPLQPVPVPPMDVDGDGQPMAIPPPPKDSITTLPPSGPTTLGGAETGRVQL
ncbi:MAG: TolC family protein [Fuerstiella sp.]